MGFLIGGALLWMAQLALPPHLQLTYHTVAGCPDEPEVRSRVRAEVGAEVFDGVRSRGVTLTIREAAVPQRGLVGEIEFRDETGQRDGWRRLESRDGDCDELIRGFALLTALHLQQFDKARPREAPSPVGSKKENESARARPALTPRRAVRTRAPSPSVAIAVGASKAVPAKVDTAVAAVEPRGAVEPRVEVSPSRVEVELPGVVAASSWQWLPGAGLLAHSGLSPRLVPGIHADLEARLPRWALAMGIDLMNLGGSPGGSFEFSGLASLGWVSPCVAAAVLTRIRFDMCPMVAVGLVGVRGRGVDRPQRDQGLLVHLGLDGRISLAIAGPWALSTVLGMAIDPIPWSVAVDGIDRWSAPAWSLRGAFLVRRLL